SEHRSTLAIWVAPPERGAWCVRRLARLAFDRCPHPLWLWMSAGCQDGPAAAEVLLLWDIVQRVSRVHEVRVRVIDLAPAEAGAAEIRLANLFRRLEVLFEHAFGMTFAPDKPNIRDSKCRRWYGVPWSHRPGDICSISSVACQRGHAGFFEEGCPVVVPPDRDA